MGPHQRPLTRWFAQQFSRRLALRDLDQPRIPGAVHPIPDHLLMSGPLNRVNDDWSGRPESNPCSQRAFPMKNKWERCYDVEANRRTKSSAVSATSRQPESITSE
jgi:hypothetical protein